MKKQEISITILDIFYAGFQAGKEGNKPVEVAFEEFLKFVNSNPQYPKILN